MIGKKKRLTTQVFKRLDILVLLIILAVALLFRLYKINNTIAEWHSWRQSDTAAVARNFVGDFNLLTPRYDDLSNIQSGQYNPQGLRLVEFPLYNGLMASLYKIAPVVPLEIYGRTVTIFFSLLLISIIYYLGLKEHGRLTAVLSSLVFAVFPFFVFYSRAILPEMTAVSLMFVSIASLYYFVNGKKMSRTVFAATYCIALAAAAVSILIKPTTIFYFLTLLFLFFKKYGIRIITNPFVYLFFILAAVPLVAWRVWILQFPEGIPASSWLLFAVNTPEGLQRIFMRPAFFRWVFHERILNLILGGFMGTFLVTGIIAKGKKVVLFYALGISSLVYLLTFQGGNVQHDYYQVIILPTLALFVGRGAAYFLQGRSVVTSTVLVVPVIVAIFVSSFVFSYYKIRDYYNTNGEVEAIAKLVKTFTTPEDKIVTDTLGDTTLLYLSERKGYPAVVDDLHVLEGLGMSYFVTTKGDVAEKVKLEFEPVFESEKVYIFRL